MSDFTDQALQDYAKSLATEPAPESQGLSDFGSQALREYERKLKSEGLPDQMVVKPGTTTPRAATPYGPNEAIATGATLGFGPNITAAVSSLGGDFASRPERYQAALARINAAKAAYERENPGQSLALETLGSVPTTLGAMAAGQEYLAAPALARVAATFPRVGAIADFLAGGYEGGALGRAISQASGGAGQGAVSGLLTSKLGDQTPGEAAGVGATVGAGVNPLTGILARPLASSVTPEVADMAQRFMDLGVPLRGSQLPGAPLAARAFSAGPSESQLAAAYRAVSRTFGEDTPHLTNDLLFGPQGAAKRIGAEMENITQNHNIPLNAPLLNGLGNIRTQAASDLASVPGDLARVTRHLDDIETELHASGGLSGKGYQSLTKYGSGLYRDLKSNNANLSHYAGEIKDVLDNAWDAALPPAAQAQWQGAKAQYKALMTVKPAIDETTQGVNFGRLYNSVRLKNRGSTAPAGDLGTLAEGGRNFLSAGEAPSAAHGISPRAALTGAGGLAVGVPLIEHLAPEAFAGVAEHPLAAGGLGALGALYGSGGALYAGPLGARVLAATGGRGLRLPANPLIPATEGLYRRRGEEGASSQ